MLGTDVCVPISRLAECIVDTKADMDAASFPVTLVGHVGDGNFHLGFLIDPDDPAEIAEAERHHRPAGAARAGHGRHLHRRARHRPGQAPLLEAEHGDAVELMRVLKNAIDPKGIMNPGKVLP